MYRLRTLVPLFLVLFAGQVPAALIVNAAQPITQTVWMQPIIVSDNDGSNTATFFGDSTQQATILNLIDQIWAQAGIDVNWLAANAWNNTFANIGSATTLVARSTGDLDTIVTTGDAAGVGSTNPLVIDIYFSRAAAGFKVLDANTAAGLAFVDGNGISAYVGANLLTFQTGLEAIASVIAHEIGHNLSLAHIVDSQNLMEASMSGQRLTNTQITAALNSPLSQVPEPSTWLLVSVVLMVPALRRRTGAFAK